MEALIKYAEVILPVPLPGYFTYIIPSNLEYTALPGKRVVVSFGKRRVMAGIIRRITDECKTTSEPKNVLDVLDEEPLLDENHLRLWEWMARYYLCTPGEVMMAAMPALFRLESETSVSKDPSWNGKTEHLTDNEYLIVEALKFSEKLTISQIAEIIGRKKVLNLLQGLIEKGVLISCETIVDSYKPKTISMVRLGDPYCNETELRDIFTVLEKRAYKQLELLMYYVQKSNISTCNSEGISRQQLLEETGASAASFTALLAKGIFEEFTVEVSRLGNFQQISDPGKIVLSKQQNEALQSINEGFIKNSPVLLHGVTGSGKTEIYIKLISNVLDQGKQVLYLLPEIALTSQIINRMRSFFGNKVQIFHSRNSDRERAELWNRIIRFKGEDNDPFILISARSGIFLPLTDPGLVIIDEEHDYSFKQSDPAPRYHARDAAIMYARIYGIPVLLGSATPAVESYHNAVTGKYHLVNLPVRYGESRLPEVLVADVAEAMRRREMKSHYTPLLISQIKKALTDRQQVILFQNRRGFSLRVYCLSCGWHPGCPNCDVTLTYHKFIDKLKCHYCGYLRSVPSSCNDCGSGEIRTSGFGTEKIEEEISILFPEAVVQRMDFDTTRKRNSYQNIIQDFEKRKTDILIGTQMVTKGLDFSNVGVVGVMNADSMIAFPDFRSFERSFQHIVQVSGRAGRQAKRGIVVVQTTRPGHDVIKLAIGNNYTGMFNLQISERKQFLYPPFCRLVRIVCKSTKRENLNDASMQIATSLRSKFPDPVLGPEYPAVSRIKNQYIRHILIKLTPDGTLSEKKRIVGNVVNQFKSNPAFRSVRFIIDVDPY